MSHSVVESPEAVLAACEVKGIAYLPFFPLAVGALGKSQPAPDHLQENWDARQVALTKDEVEASAREP